MTTWVPHGMLRFRQLRLQFIAEIGVAGDDHVARGDLAARGADHRRAGVCWMRVTGDCSYTRPPFRRMASASPDGKVQRVNMAAAVVEQGADVAVAVHFATNGLSVQQLQLGVAVALPVGFLLFQGFPAVYGSSPRTGRPGGNRTGSDTAGCVRG